MSQFDSVRLSAGELFVQAGVPHSGFAMAQASRPERPVHDVMPFSPGGNTHIQSRLLSHLLSESLGQGSIVENRVGASMIKTTAVLPVHNQMFPLVSKLFLQGLWCQSNSDGFGRAAPGRVTHRLPTTEITSTIPTTDKAKPMGIL